MVGPTIWPKANTMVKTLMPWAQREDGRLWRTSAVVEATTERNTPPNSSPETSATGAEALSTGSKVATPSSPLSSACGCPPR